MPLDGQLSGHRGVSDRRRFLATTAMALAALEAGLLRRTHAQGHDDMPSLGGATAWLNSPPLTPAGLRGKVVVVDFWTYTCINWLRTLPYLRAWAKQYGRHGLVVLGVRFAGVTFEKDLENVRSAVTSMRIGYPVAVDSDHAVWRAFANQYWPALYFVDAQGRIRDRHFGEGRYEESESVIRRLGQAGVGGLPGEPSLSLSAHQTIGSRRRPPIRDRVSRRGGEGLRVHVRLTGPRARTRLRLASFTIVICRHADSTRSRHRARRSRRRSRRRG